MLAAIAIESEVILQAANKNPERPQSGRVFSL